jgi:hypothetical protein
LPIFNHVRKSLAFLQVNMFKKRLSNHGILIYLSYQSFFIRWGALDNIELTTTWFSFSFGFFIISFAFERNSATIKKCNCKNIWINGDISYPLFYRNFLIQPIDTIGKVIHITMTRVVNKEQNTVVIIIHLRSCNLK